MMRRLLLAFAAVACSPASLAVASGPPPFARVTARPRPETPAEMLRRRNIESINSRTDFLGYYSGSDNTWSPSYCYGSVTTFGSFVNCCQEGYACTFPIGCSGMSITETVFDEGTRMRTLQERCTGVGPSTCKTTTILQSAGAPNLTRFACGLNTGFVLGGTNPTLVQTIPNDAAVFATTPSDSFTNPGTITRRTSGPPISSPSDPFTSGATGTGSSSSSSTRTQDSGSGPNQTSGTSTSDSGNGGGSSGGLTNAEKIGIGVGVGLGLPLVALALLAWLFPHPLRRLREHRAAKSAAAAAPTTPSTNAAYPATMSDKSELPSTFPPNTPWGPEAKPELTGTADQSPASAQPYYAQQQGQQAGYYYPHQSYQGSEMYQQQQYPANIMQISPHGVTPAVEVHGQDARWELPDRTQTPYGQ